MFSKLDSKKESIYYTGDHLARMFDRLRRKLKSEDKKFSFIKAKSENLKGVILADLWAGYINYSLKGKMDLVDNNNLILSEYIENFEK